MKSVIRVLALVVAVVLGAGAVTAANTRSARSFMPVKFPASDGKQIHGEVIGGGSVGIVIAHDADSTLAGWKPAARFLSLHGYRVLLFDYRRNPFDSQGGSYPRGTFRFDRDVAGGVRLLRRLGSRTIVLGGDGIGGLVALVTASELGNSVAGTFTLTAGSIKGGTDSLGDRSQPDDLDALAAVRHLETPVLFLAAGSDSNVRPLLRATAAANKRWYRLPEAALEANGFGMSMWTVGAPWAQRARATIIAFLPSRR